MRYRKYAAPLLLVLLSIGVLVLLPFSRLSRTFAFSVQPGFYPEPFYVEISAPSGEIYYTLDGSDPDRNSLRYTRPLYIQDATPNDNVLASRDDLDSYIGKTPDAIEIDTVLPTFPVDKCTTLKAVYYSLTGEKSETLCASYFVGYENRVGYGDLKVVSLVAPPENLTGYDTGIFVRGKTYDEEVDEWYVGTPGNYSIKGREWEREATFQFFDTDGTLLYESPCGIRIMGGWHRKSVLKSLNLYARTEYGGLDRFQYDFWGTGYQPHKMTLHSGSNDYYGKIQNMLVSDLTRGLDYGTMHYEVCLLFLNGEYWGIYNLTEKYDSTYLSDTYHVNKDDVLSVKAEILENGYERDFHLYKDAIDFVSNADMTQPENYERFQQLFDEQSLLDLFGTEIYCGRYFDWPNGNIHLWRTVSDSGDGFSDGRWRYLLYDMDSVGLTKAELEMDTVAFAQNASPYFNSLCKNETFRKKLGATILRIGTQLLSSEQVRSAVEDYRALLADPMKVYFKRFFDSDESRFYERTDSNLYFFENRLPFMKQILEAHDMLP